MSLGTPWGLFRHYWVIISLVLTVIATAVLLQHMPAVSVLARAVWVCCSSSGTSPEVV